MGRGFGLGERMLATLPYPYSYPTPTLTLTLTPTLTPTPPHPTLPLLLPRLAPPRLAPPRPAPPRPAPTPTLSYPTLPVLYSKMQFDLETYFRILQVSARRETVWLLISKFSLFRHQTIRTFNPRYITTWPNCTATIAFLVNKLLFWDDYSFTFSYYSFRLTKFLVFVS